MIASHAVVLETPHGRFALLAQGEAILACWDPTPDLVALRSSGRLDDVAARVLELLTGGDPAFDDVPTPDGPDFHRRCWDACRTIEAGASITYAELARRAGAPAAARAAGQAMRHNPLPIIVPCHRVVGARGLVGYAGATDPAGTSLQRKAWLLEVERPVGTGLVRFSDG